METSIREDMNVEFRRARSGRGYAGAKRREAPVREATRSVRTRSGPGEGVWGNREVPPAPPETHIPAPATNLHIPSAAANLAIGSTLEGSKLAPLNPAP